MEPWRRELRTLAGQVIADFQKKEWVLGVMLGGSLARRQEWRHSDLDLGLLVEERNPNQPEFNVISGRGVEAIQLVRGEIEEQVRLVETGDCDPILTWPFEFWRGRIVSDPTGLLAQFKQQLDTWLFATEVVEKRLVGLRAKIAQGLEEARGCLAQEKPSAALALTRQAMNDAILAFNWAHGELPRSQIRNDRRLRLLCRQLSQMPFYELYLEVFGLDNTSRLIRSTWPAVKDQVLEITRVWGDSVPEFFDVAVDGNFAWGYNAGVLTIYRLYVPILGAPERGIFAHLDDAGWRRENTPLLRFLDLEKVEKEQIASLVERVAGSCACFSSPSKGHG